MNKDTILKLLETAARDSTPANERLAAMDAFGRFLKDKPSVETFIETVARGNDVPVPLSLARYKSTLQQLQDRNDQLEEQLAEYKSSDRRELLYFRENAHPALRRKARLFRAPHE